MQRFLGLALGLTLATQLTGQGTPAGTVRGVVLDPLCKPVANAVVEIRSWQRELLHTTRTDGEGRFFVDRLPLMQLFVRSTSDGMAWTWEYFYTEQDASKSKDLVVRLYPGATVKGQVLSAAGKPVAKAQVTGSFELADAFNTTWCEYEETVTDDEGRFEMPKVPLGDIRVRASAAGFQFGETSLYLRSDAETQLKLEPGDGRALTVRVTGLPAAQLEGARCTLMASGDAGKIPALPQRLCTGRLDASGAWTVKGLPPQYELWNIRVRAPWLQLHPRDHRVPAGDRDTTVVFKLERLLGPRPAPRQPPRRLHESEVAVGKPTPAPGRPKPRHVPVANPTLKGRVRDASGKAMAGFVLRVWGEGPGWRQAVTDGEGRFGLDSDYSASRVISIYSEDDAWALTAKGAQVTRHAGSPGVQMPYSATQDYELEALPTVSVAGLLKNPKGRPAQGVWVQLMDRRQRREVGELVGGAWTDDKGAFAMTGILPNSNALYLEVDGLQGATVHGPIKLKGKSKGLSGLKVKLEAPMQVEGRVRDRRGKALPGARVTLVAGEFGDAEEFVTGPNTITDRDGRYVLRGMKPGEYVVQVRVRGLKVAARTKPFALGKRKLVKQRLRVR